MAEKIRVSQEETQERERLERLFKTFVALEEEGLAPPDIEEPRDQVRALYEATGRKEPSSYEITLLTTHFVLKGLGNSDRLKEFHVIVGNGLKAGEVEKLSKEYEFIAKKMKAVK